MRILGAIVLAVVLSYVWVRAAVLLFGLSELMLFTVCAVGGALIALAARIAGRWRWAVGVPLLLVFEGGATAACLGLMALGSGEARPPAGALAGALLGAFVIGPAILAPAAANGQRLPTAGAPAQARSRGSRLTALGIALAVLGALGVTLVALHAIRQRQLGQIRRDLLPAVEDLVRTDVLAHLGPVVWDGPRWLGRTRIGARGLMSGNKVSLSWFGELPMRQFGEVGKAEGLRVDPLGLGIEVTQPRTLTHQEVKDLEVVKPFLVSIGLRPELVAALSPGMAGPGSGGLYTASRNGLTYVITVDKPGATTYLVTVDRQTGNCVDIHCGGVRSAASP